MSPAKWGQNFLANKNVAEKIVRHFLPVEGPILEIGPGKGILTDLLIKHRGNNLLKAVELDETLVYSLRNRYRGEENLEIVNRNILKTGIPHVFPGEGRGIHVISNVPYYISSDIIDWVISQAQHVRGGVLMFQKEFVAKLAARPNTKEYNPQGLMFGYLYHLEKAFDVQRGSFSPPPKVTSTVFRFRGREELEPGTELLEKEFYDFLKDCFRNRRKTLLNNLERHFHSERVWGILEEFHINPRVRAEQLEPGIFPRLFRRLDKKETGKGETGQRSLFETGE